MKIIITIVMIACMIFFILNANVIITKVFGPVKMPFEVKACMERHANMIHCDKQYDYWFSWCHHENRYF